jgi:hypothetical protein
MSSIFLTSEFKNLLSENHGTETLSVSNVLNKYIKQSNDAQKITSTTVNNSAYSNLSATSPLVSNNTNSVTSSAVHTGTIDVSATSSLNMNGGNYMNNNHNKDDVDSLVAMLTSTESNTQTEVLETKLKGLLNNKVGGGNVGGDNVDGGTSELSNVKQFFHKLKSNGVNVDIKLDDLTLSDFFNTNIIRKNLVGGQPATAPVSTAPAPVSTASPHLIQGGGRDLPPALVAFQKIRSIVAKELDLKGIKVSAKVASALKKEVTKKHPNADPMEIANIAIKYFKDHKKEYEELAKSLS